MVPTLHQQSDSNRRVSPPRSGFTLLEGLVVLAIALLLIALLWPNHGRSHHAARQRSQTRNDLKMIGLALHNYHDEYGMFPPAVLRDDKGTVLHSWRTLILPYLDQAPLYQKIDLSKPYNDPVNAEAYRTAVNGYRSVYDQSGSAKTRLLAVVGPDYAFDSTRPRKIPEFTAGTSTSFMVIEVAESQAVHWMDPVDADEKLLKSLGPRGSFPHESGFHALYADGSTRFISVKEWVADRASFLSITGPKSTGSAP
jgi:type II secretory pathway pseudopilin PulG